MRAFFVAATCILVCSDSNVANAQDGANVTLQSSPLNEEYREAAQISGSVVMGLTSGGAAAIERPSLHAYVPAAWAGQTICVSISSADGLYDASNDYRVPENWTGSTVSLAYPTSYAELLSNTTQFSIAVNVQEGACGSKVSGSGTVAYWNSIPAEAPTELGLMLNSFRADTVVIYVGEGPAAVAITCDEPDLPILAAFDRRCAIPAEALATSGMTKFNIFRIRSAEAEPPVSVTFFTGPPTQ
jgi:hypothetical protein